MSVTGTQLNSEIKTGFDYTAYLQGLEATRSASQIKRLFVRGDLVNSVTSATVRTGADKEYSRSGDTNGPGSIKAYLKGTAINTGGTTALGNSGAGVFARHISALKAKV